jgi:hypothetical protein
MKDLSCIFIIHKNKLFVSNKRKELLIPYKLFNLKKYFEFLKYFGWSMTISSEIHLQFDSIDIRYKTDLRMVFYYICQI